MKKTLSILLLCCLLLTSSALAEGLPPGAQVIELDRTLTIDDTTWPEDTEPPSYEVNTWLFGFQPLPDGAKVLSGFVDYPGIYRNPYTSAPRSLEDLRRSEAYALCLEPDGAVRWELRLADPQADNSFWPAGLLPDGRILMRFLVYDTTFGPKYFIVGQDGFVEAMLDHRKLSEAFPPLSLMLVTDGYLGGNSSLLDEHHDRYFGVESGPIEEWDHQLTLLDFDLNPVWTLDMAEYTGKVRNTVALGLREGTLLYGSCDHPEDPENSDAYQAFAMQVDPEGGVAWQYTGGQDDRARVIGAVETEDGVLLMERSHENVADDPHTLTRLIALDGGGEELFAVDLSAEEGLAAVAYFVGLASLDDGYVLSGHTETQDETLLAHIDAQGKLLGTLLLSPDADGTVYGHNLQAGADGKTYLYGMVRKAEREESWWNSDGKGFYYAELTPESFQ